jgi:hypothetical protein
MFTDLEELEDVEEGFYVFFFFININDLSGTCVVFYGGMKDEFYLKNIESQTNIRFQRVGCPQMFFSYYIMYFNYYLFLLKY